MESVNCHRVCYGKRPHRIAHVSHQHRRCKHRLKLSADVYINGVKGMRLVVVTTSHCKCVLRCHTILQMEILVLITSILNWMLGYPHKEACSGSILQNLLVVEFLFNTKFFHDVYPGNIAL